jgi:hypothetical protein
MRRPKAEDEPSIETRFIAFSFALSELCARDVCLEEASAEASLVVLFEMCGRDVCLEDGPTAETGFIAEALSVVFSEMCGREL